MLHFPEEYVTFWRNMLHFGSWVSGPKLCENLFWRRGTVVVPRHKVLPQDNTIGYVRSTVSRGGRGTWEIALLLKSDKFIKMYDNM